MSNLKNHYQEILKELEDHFQNKEDKKFVLNKFQDLSMMFMNVIDKLTNLSDERIKEIEEKQQRIDSRIEMIQKTVNGIENDIYEDDETYEFEIVCPYCNYEFVADINSEENSDIECPECHNLIELDWNEENGCDSRCLHCNECEENDEYNCGDNCKDNDNCSCKNDEDEDM